MKITFFHNRYWLISTTEVNFLLLWEAFLKDNKIEEGCFVYIYCKKIFDAFFRYSINLREQYTKFYNIEYETFDQYLFEKELLDKGVIENLLKEFGDELWIYQINVSNMSYNINSLLEYNDEVDIVSMINTFLERYSNES